MWASALVSKSSCSCAVAWCVYQVWSFLTLYQVWSFLTEEPAVGGGGRLEVTDRSMSRISVHDLPAVSAGSQTQNDLISLQMTSLSLRKEMDLLWWVLLRVLAGEQPKQQAHSAWHIGKLS